MIQRIVSRWDSSKVLFECELPDGLDSAVALRNTLEKANLRNADLRGAGLRGAYLSGADLRGADLSSADLRIADLRGADLRGAYLSGADLTSANLSGADLRGATLSDANLRRAYLIDADLRGAYLRGANLSIANLGGADLRGADLSSADLSSAYLLAVPAETQIARLDKVRAIILDDATRLGMESWHEDEGWRDRSCAEETLCGTTHCLTGWLQVCSTDPEIRKKDPEFAGCLLAPVAAPMFCSSKAHVLEWLRDRAYVQQLAKAASTPPEVQS